MLLFLSATGNLLVLFSMRSSFLEAKLLPLDSMSLMPYHYVFTQHSDRALFIGSKEERNQDTFH